MSNEIINAEVQCPYCWEHIDVVVDDCGENQQYVEDCQVCCRPINFHIIVDESQQMSIRIFSDDE